MFCWYSDQSLLGDILTICELSGLLGGNLDTFFDMWKPSLQIGNRFSTEGTVVFLTLYILFLRSVISRFWHFWHTAFISQKQSGFVAKLQPIRFHIIRN